MTIKEYNSFHNSLENMIKQQLQIADIVAKNSIAERQTQLVNNLKAITPVITSIINNSAYEKLLINTSRLAETINKNLSPHLINITNSTYDKLLKCDFSALTTLQKSISNLNISDLNIASIDFNENGNITYENETFTPEEINNNTSELVLKASTGTMEYSDIKKHPIISLSLILIMYIIFNLIIPDIFSSAKQYIKENYFTNKTEISENDYNAFRIITTDVLNVRRNHSTDSDIIGKLYYLNVVKVINSYPYWLKIEYKDVNSNVQITGWISTKYTADFSQETENILKLNNN